MPHRKNKGETLTLANNHVVSIEYEVRENGSADIIDSNVGGKPLEFLLGAGQVIQGLENALLGAQVGEKKSVVVAPEEAYGVRYPDYVQEVPREQFEGIELVQGMTLFGQGEDGQTVQVIVQEFNDQVVIVDYNHPLAGKALQFEVTVLEAREATEKEILQGSACGNHEHDHECCGGSGSHGCGCH
ncbi:FKBP-type peptidyl-prolyl cis-trans isomerase [Wolinella succinogenes]|uniref:FKBP-type peptidyl-prolyl cis-trans isomerase n=1 Tax=Wolinella succinogenes TaxID=844 RepID=UPI00067413B3|nr:peptidylprolyl isomerase [Wolinella succinogenes]HCZ19282.1 peptidylprolyl isomerase [Helicobacter sp.]